MSTTPPGWEAARALVHGILGCSVELTDDARDWLETFETDHCYDPTWQPGFTAPYLLDHVNRMDRGAVHELVEPLGLSVILLWLDESLVVIGPYAQDSIRPGEAEALLGRLRIPGSQLQPYQWYRARYAIVDAEYALRAAAALAALSGHGPAEVVVERITAARAEIVPGGAEVPHSAPLDGIADRYALEREFMLAVAEGHERAALATLQRMASLPQYPSYLTTPYLGATILRILTRIAAQQGGLPPLTIDAVSQTYAQRLHRSGHTLDPQRTNAAIGAMVSDFCQQITRYRMHPYSRLVRQVIAEVELHLSHHVSPKELAGRLGVSESHLARQFKAETGHTISEHVARERANRAAQLLATTQQPVRDIAAYVGYLDANYFVKVFRSIHGVTPTAYRVQHSR